MPDPLATACTRGHFLSCNRHNEEQLIAGYIMPATGCTCTTTDTLPNLPKLLEAKTYFMMAGQPVQQQLIKNVPTRITAQLGCRVGAQRRHTATFYRSGGIRNNTLISHMSLCTIAIQSISSRFHSSPSLTKLALCIPWGISRTHHLVARCLQIRSSSKKNGGKRSQRGPAANLYSRCSNQTSSTRSQSSLHP